MSEEEYARAVETNLAAGAQDLRLIRVVDVDFLTGFYALCRAGFKKQKPAQEIADIARELAADYYAKGRESALIGLEESVRITSTGVLLSEYRSDGYKLPRTVAGQLELTGDRHWYDLSGPEQDIYLLSCFEGEAERLRTERKLGLYNFIATSIAYFLLSERYDLHGRDAELLARLGLMSGRRRGLIMLEFSMGLLKNTLLGTRLTMAIARMDGLTRPQGTVPEEIDHAMNPMLFFNSIGVVKTRGLEILSLDCVMPFKTEAERQEEWDSLSADERRRATKEVEEAFDKVAADAGLPPAKVEQSNAPTAVPSTRSPQIKPPSQRSISTRTPGRYWGRLPEVVRWILFFPTVLLVWGAANLVWLVAMSVAELFGYGPANEFWWMVSGAFFSASIIFPSCSR